ncbi:hypothetical protein [Lacrimispora indolis]|nr:hypothetical protein [[Clostridium] methoxybenzovorans]
MEKKHQKPDCYEPEKYVAYPLCMGNDTPECEACYLYVDFPEPYDDY